MTCTHSVKKHIWIPEQVHHFWDGLIDIEEAHTELREISTCVDIDLHRYTCTQCDEIFYYSQRAREHYEGTAFHPIIAESIERQHRKNKDENKFTRA